MKTNNILIDNIPVVLWGEHSAKVFIAVHGNMSSKTDKPIAMLAEEATAKGYQVLSFDLPEHGERKNDPTILCPQNAVPELKKIMGFARLNYKTISLWANSIGAYFSLAAYKDEALEEAMFLSPVTDMRRLIENMMMWFDVSEKRLFAEKEIPTPMGQPLNWDYYQFVKDNPIEKWDTKTKILYGKKDELCEYDFVLSFAQKFDCDLKISTESEHFFHTDEDMRIYRDWLRGI